MEQTGFISTRNKGFRMHFSNGFEISVQWGPGNYCEKRWSKFEDQEKSIFLESCSAEIAVFNTNEAKMVAEKGMISLNGDDVVSGWLSADQVAKAISVVQSAKTVNEIQTKLKALKI